ncbi:MAG TPA: hypothetical protein VFA37_02750 [Gaiellaceae bacterium]|nr:hypothetical protein [Gaiellaceae bacterium]
MSSLWEQRAARNEALFREVNENIAELEERYGTSSEPVFVCECADDGCAERLDVDAATYKRVRENSRRFLVLPGHVDSTLEKVVEEHPSFLIVEKTGAAGDVAAQADV